MTSPDNSPVPAATATFAPPAPLRTAVLFVVFNRPEPTARVFEAIRKARPPRLYVAADGPRDGREGEAEKVEAVRRIATSVDWPCDVRTLFRAENLGCRYGPSLAISWFFDNEEQGIILEDDCLPNQSFFWFCETLLDRYRCDTRIWQISGTTFFADKISLTGSDYIFSRYGPIWGWASWRRAWNHYDVDLNQWPEMKRPEMMENVYPDPSERGAKLRLGDRLFEKGYDAWDYQWGMTKNYNNGLSVIPMRNLIQNIGFDIDATHTINAPDDVPEGQFDLSSDLRHPQFVIRDLIYDHSYARQKFRKVRFVDRVLGRARRLMRTKA